MRTFYRTSAALLAISLLYACNDNRLKNTTPGSQTILSYCGDSISPSLKHQAAKFLIDNMDAHYSISGEYIDSFYQYMDSIFSLPVQSNAYYRAAYDTAYMRYGERVVTSMFEINDTAQVTAEMLMKHIEDAFNVWNKPWNGKYDFEHFCNYVLPYRIDDEPLSHWRERYIAQQLPKVDKFANSQENYLLVSDKTFFLENKKLGLVPFGGISPFWLFWFYHKLL